MTNGVTAWSYSAWALYDECPAKYKYAKIDKLPDPPGPAMARGREVHKAVETYLKEPKKHQFPMEHGKKFVDLILALRDAPNLLVEQQWCFTKDWRETGWFDKRGGHYTPWLRSVVDAGVIYEDGVVEVVDWKTGKLYATNEDQMELFALTAMVRYKQAPMVITRLAYLDDGAEIIVEHDASDREKLKAKWERKVQPLFNETIWAPKPSTKACRFCNFSRSKGGPCKEG